MKKVCSTSATIKLNMITIQSLFIVNEFVIDVMRKTLQLNTNKFALDRGVPVINEVPQFACCSFHKIFDTMLLVTLVTVQVNTLTCF